MTDALVAAKLARPVAPRRRPPLPPEASSVNGDGPVSITAYNHRCPVAGCRQWAPNHRTDCGEHG